MEATEAKLLGFLKQSPQFVIPIYQRTSSWAEKQCHQLWDDIVRTGGNDGISVHFVGYNVYIATGLSQVTLLISALAKALGETESVDGFSPRTLRNYYLLNPEETGERHYKLFLSQTDRASLPAIVGGTDQRTEHSLYGAGTAVGRATDGERSGGVNEHRH